MNKFPFDGAFAPSIDADLLTVTPFLGSESIAKYVCENAERFSGLSDLTMPHMY